MPPNPYTSVIRSSLRPGPRWRLASRPDALDRPGAEMQLRTIRIGVTSNGPALVSLVADIRARNCVSRAARAWARAFGHARGGGRGKQCGGYGLPVSACDDGRAFDRRSRVAGRGKAGTRDAAFRAPGQR